MRLNNQTYISNIIIKIVFEKSEKIQEKLNSLITPRIFITRANK